MLVGKQVGWLGGWVYNKASEEVPVKEQLALTISEDPQTLPSCLVPAVDLDLKDRPLETCDIFYFGEVCEEVNT